MVTLKELDSQYLWHPFTQMLTALPPIPITKAEGCYLYAEDGKRYLDAISSWWVNLHGHCHPHIVSRVSEQMNRLEHVMFAGFTHQPAVELAEKLLRLLPGPMGKIFYSDNGSTAIETALKVSLQFFYNQNPNTSRNKVLCLKNSYHGDTFGAMSAAGRNRYNQPFWKHLFDIESIEMPKTFQELNLNEIEKLFSKGEIACFIFETLIMGAGGMLVYPAESLDVLLGLCKKYQIITIADEVLTGFFRTGTLFACDRLKNSPDIVCLSKGLTGGFLPFALTAFKEEIYQQFLSDEPSKAFLHGHTFCGNPLGCAAALASLELLLTEETQQNIRMICDSHQKFSDLANQQFKLKRCQTLGTFLIWEYHSEEKISEKISFFLSKGIVVRPIGSVFYILPPYCINEEELNYIYQCLEITWDM